MRMVDLTAACVFDRGRLPHTIDRLDHEQQRALREISAVLVVGMADNATLARTRRPRG